MALLAAGCAVALGVLSSWLAAQMDSRAGQEAVAASYSSSASNGNGRHAASNGSKPSNGNGSNGNGSSGGGGWMSSKILQSLGLRPETAPEPPKAGAGSSYGQASKEVDILASDDDLDEESLAMLTELVELAKSLAGDASKDLQAAQLASSATSSKQRRRFVDVEDEEAAIAREVEAEASMDM